MPGRHRVGILSVLRRCGLRRGPGLTGRTIRSQIATSEEAQGWQFRIDWYDALLDGRPMLGDAGRTGEMLEKIALIDPATWDAGPEVVNPVIREIWELHRLRSEVAALQAEKAAFPERTLAARRAVDRPRAGKLLCAQGGSDLAAIKCCQTND